MIKLFFLTIFLLLGSYSLKADETSSDDQDFMNELDSVKNPFEDGLPKPVIIKETPAPVVVPPAPPPVEAPQPLPNLELDGVMVGEDAQSPHEAIINGQIVPLGGVILGAKVLSITKKGVEMLFNGKKYFLKIE